MAQGSTKGIPISTDSTLSANSDALVPSQRAVKQYADSRFVQKEDSANKSTSTSDSGSSVKFPVWSAIVAFFSASQIRSILGITTLSGSNTGDETTATIQSKRPLKTVNGNSLEGSGNISVFTMYQLSVDVTSTSDVLADISGWNFPVTAGKNYRIEIIAGFQTAATTTGGSIGVRTSAANTGVIRGFTQADVTNATAASGLKKVMYDVSNTYVFTARMTSTGVAAQNAEHSWHLLINFKCNNTGTFYVGWSSEVNTSAATLKQDSVLLVTEI